MGDIVLLDDLTINKIAAGEVIERPASVVKELLENSIDAGSKNITVEIKNGGISMIRITDDGSGIAQDDMEIAFERHATSKIRRADDLAKVTSMGFRGEALASIAAISKVEMISKKNNSNSAFKIVVEGGKTIEFCETARNVGTTITVENLFYNTPVRYKFLKKDYTEAGYIEDVVNRLALVNLNVAIKLVSNGKTILQTSGMGDLKKVIYNIYGKDTALETVDVDYEYEEIRVSGVVGNPVIARSNRSNQLFFLNGRYIKDKNLTAAVDQAFKGIVPVGRYGFAVLNLQMDPKTVDVNVHPAKLEVRFEDEAKVFKAVYHAIKSSMTHVNKTNEEMQNTFDFMNSYYQKKKETKIEATNPINLKKSYNSYNYDKPLDEKWNNKYSADSISDSNYEFNGKKSDDKKNSGIVGLFKKIIKEPEETEDEINNNYLADIYKSNYGLGEGTEISAQKETLSAENISMNVDTSVNSKPENKLDVNIQNSINDKLLNKSIVLGDALISSNTMQINVTDTDSDNINNANDIIQTASPKIETELQKNVSISINDNYTVNEAFRRVIENTNTQELDASKKYDDTQIINVDKDIWKENSKVKTSNTTIDDNTSEVDLNNVTLNENISEVELNDEKIVESTNVVNNSNEVINDKTEKVNISDDNTKKIEFNFVTKEENTSEIYLNDETTNENTSEGKTADNIEEKMEYNEDIVDDKLDELNSNNKNIITEEQNTGDTIISNTNIVNDSNDYESVDNTNEVIEKIEKNNNTNETIDNSKNNDNTNESLTNIEKFDINSKHYNSINDEEFKKMASGIIEAKMDSDSTQMVDTQKVRDALNESDKETTPEFEEMYKKTFGIETFSQRKEKEFFPLVNSCFNYISYSCNSCIWLLYL